MTGILRDIIMILSGIIAGFIIWKLKDFIFKKFQNKVYEIGTPNIVDFKGKKIEEFDLNKLKSGLVSISDKVKWAKTITSDFNLRTIMIRLAMIGIVIGVIYGYGLYKGKKTVPLNFQLNYSDRIEFDIPEDASSFLKPENSNMAYWIKKDGTKTIVKAGDSAYLAKKMKPYGFILEPYVSLGLAMTNKGAKQDLGLGVKLIKWFKWRAGTWISNNGIWAGVDYKITNNFSLGSGVGKGYKGDNLVGFRGQWKF